MTLVQNALKVRTSVLRLAMLMVLLGAGALVTMPKNVLLQAGKRVQVAPPGDIAAAKPKAIVGPAPDSKG